MRFVPFPYCSQLNLVVISPELTAWNVATP